MAWPSAKWMTAFPTGGALTADATLGTDAMISAARPIMTWVSWPIREGDFEGRDAGSTFHG